ncbi:MAG: ATP-binding protein [Candidatus Margulisiibacteriota bacterium]|jgi:CheY-like chemotaxis protein
MNKKIISLKSTPRPQLDLALDSACLRQDAVDYIRKLITEIQQTAAELCSPELPAIRLSEIRSEIEDKIHSASEKVLRQLNNILDCAKQKSSDSPDGDPEFQFIAKFCHDIRGLITPIYGISSMLCTKPRAGSQATDEAQIADMITYIRKYIMPSSKMILQLLNDMLDDPGPKYRRFDLRQTVNEIYNINLPKAQSKGLKLELEIDEKIPACIISDATLLERILNNLLTNALKFTEKGLVKISIRLQRVDEMTVALYFEVQDTGTGISADKLDQIFIPYLQADPSIAQKYGGSGLGLPNCVELLNSLLLMKKGNPIQITSQLGEGSTFSFVLDVIRGDLFPVKVKPLKVESLFDTLPGKSILLVADEPAVQGIMEPILLCTKALVQTTSSINEALDRMQRTGAEAQYDYIIISSKEPTAVCEQFIKSIRTRDQAQGIHTFIFVFDDNAVLEKDLQADRYLLNPFCIQELLEEAIALASKK